MSKLYRDCNNLGSTNKYKNLPEPALQRIYLDRKRALSNEIDKRDLSSIEAVRAYEAGVRSICEELGI